ncbi:MAG: NAD(P)/FAD-dependent oxidoreductase [Sulfurovum sp.]|nr:NAD(P)/FAD-dependent oxidoreductase [Sulfurovum sp.]
MNNKSDPHLIIVGGGASGLVASIVAAKSGMCITLLEQNSQIGKKIRISGNGKCNITNKNIVPERFHSCHKGFIETVLQDYGFDAVKTFFTSIGLELVEGKEGKMFPMSLQASSVSELLEYEAKKLGVNFICDCRVDAICKKNDIFILETTQGIHKCEKLLLASGSPAAPQLGGNDSGLHFAKQMGHTIIPNLPSLVQLCSKESWIKHASGVKCEGIAKLYANGEYITEKKGDLLFTAYGISGLAILDLSREASIHLAQHAYCELILDLIPKLNKEKLTALLLMRIQKESQKPLSLWLQGIINKKLIPVILEQSKCKAIYEYQLNRKEIGKLVFTLKNLKLSISDTKGFKGAEVAAGGIDTAEVNPQTMESKRVKNLYFAGEILDVDADRGGFNFHFAWVSALRAGKALKSNYIF